MSNHHETGKRKRRAERAAALAAEIQYDDSQGDPCSFSSQAQQSEFLKEMAKAYRLPANGIESYNGNLFEPSRVFAHNKSKEPSSAATPAEIARVLAQKKHAR